MSTQQPSLSDALGGVVAPGDVVADKYRVDRTVGTGGMGVVVEAFHLHFEERVAIKFLLPHMGADSDALERFEREARAAFKIKSEHVARVIDVGKIDRVPYMVMEYLEGQDLGDMLVNRQPMAVERAVGLVLQAVDAVAEAHALGIVHRDLKPENLFLTTRADGSPCVKVLDFGLSKIHAGEIKAPRSRAITATAQAMGTPQYMSPEQWMSARDVGPATDQWALGVILYELLTGHQPFHREHLAQLCTQVLRGEPEPFESYEAEVPSALRAVVLRALAKEPGDRYPNLAAFAIDLVAFAPSMKGTVRRIKGIFQRIGVETGELPSSRRGLGSLVLQGDPRGMASTGRDGPPSSDAPAPPKSRRSGAPSGVGLSRPMAPPRAGRSAQPDEATMVMPFPSEPEIPDEIEDDEPATRIRPSASDVTQLMMGPSSAPEGDFAATAVIGSETPYFPRPPGFPAHPPASPPAPPPAVSPIGDGRSHTLATAPPWAAGFVPPPRNPHLPIVIGAAVFVCLIAIIVVIVSVSEPDAPPRPAAESPEDE